MFILFVENEIDASEMQLLFQELGFSVREYVNLTVDEMRQVFEEQASANHSAYSVFGACILTKAGVTKNTFYGFDETMEVKEVVKIIGSSKSLRSKPKLLILHFTPGSSNLNCQCQQLLMLLCFFTGISILFRI